MLHVTVPMRPAHGECAVAEDATRVCICVRVWLRNKVCIVALVAALAQPAHGELALADERKLVAHFALRRRSAATRQT